MLIEIIAGVLIAALLIKINSLSGTALDESEGAAGRITSYFLYWGSFIVMGFIIFTALYKAL